MMDRQCPCACHGTHQGACDIPGGCGSVGCSYNTDSRPQERRCARGEYCADREPERDDRQRHTGVWLPARISVERGLCKRCVGQVVTALQHLPGDVVELTTLLGRPNITAETLVASSPELPVPISLGIEALRTEIDDELQGWAEPVAERLRIPWDSAAMSHTRPAVRVQRAALLLANATDTLLALGPQEHSAWENGEPVWAPEFLPELVQDVVVRDGVDGALALLDLHRRAWATAGRTEYVERRESPCHKCGWYTVVRRNGHENSECENCGKTITEEEYSRFAAALLHIRQQQAAVA